VVWSHLAKCQVVPNLPIAAHRCPAVAPAEAVQRARQAYLAALPPPERVSIRNWALDRS
jgi:hypothetical protein